MSENEKQTLKSPTETAKGNPKIKNQPTTKLGQPDKTPVKEKRYSLSTLSLRISIREKETKTKLKIKP